MQTGMKTRAAMRPSLHRLGPSWAASPVRRLVQSVFLLVFLTLFFYVCWPYSGQPKPAGAVSTGWTFTEIHQASGEFRFEANLPPEWPCEIGQTVYVTTGDTPVALEQRPVAFTVKSIADGQISLDCGELAPDVFDAFVARRGPWALHETEPNQWPSHYADDLARKEVIPVEIFLIIDPLVSLSTAIASRTWVWSLGGAASILAICIAIPRGFCAYVCPLGTSIGLFDWAISGRVKRFRVSDNGWWVHIKYYLLGAILISAVCGVLISGFFAAIPVVTRALLFLFDPLLNGTLRAWHLVPPLNLGHAISIGLFALVLSLGFLRPRFWCKYVCPSGAIFSVWNLLRATERKVESSCIKCNQCVEVCPFDAIKPDFSTRVTDCTLCRSCGGVCPTQAISFVPRWRSIALKDKNDPPTNETVIGRRGFMSLALGSTTAVTGGVGAAAVTKAFGANLDHPNGLRPVRPPGSVPEREFLEMCIRCGACFKVCPNNVLQPEHFQQGLEGLWTPMVVADWAGCDASCNACGQVCPTGAIRSLPLQEKMAARMGLAIVNESTCLPYAGRAACQLCVDECKAAGYKAIEFMQVGTEVDKQGTPIPGSGQRAPVVLAERCVGCGLCQTRCHMINVKEKGLLTESSIMIEAGEGREDRLMTGSYVELRRREAEMRAKQEKGRQERSQTEYFVPTDESVLPESSLQDPNNPFGLEHE